MGTTPKPFTLYEGPVTEDSGKFTFSNLVKINLKLLETGTVSYSAENITIGGHTFRYENVQVLSLSDMRMKTGRGYAKTKYIHLEGKDGKEYVLTPVQEGTDNLERFSAKAVELFTALSPMWENFIQRATKAHATADREQGAVEKLRKMLAVSKRIRMDMMQRALELDADTFSRKIFDWAAEFKFQIDGDFVVIEGGDVTGFISKLDAEFADWGKKDGKKV